MRKLIGVLVFVAISFVIISFVSADSYVYYDKNSKEVLFFSDEDAVILSDDDKVKIEKDILPQPVEFYGLTLAIEFYEYKNGNFILNTKKISDISNSHDEYLEKFAELEIVRKRAYLNAFIELVVEGNSFDHIKQQDFE